MEIRPVCMICHQSLRPTDAAVYLVIEDVLMHRACCRLHPSHRRLGIVESEPGAASPRDQRTARTLEWNG